MVKRIVLDPKILAGKPLIRGTRISVEFILELLASGMSRQEILDEYPSLAEKDILAALEYARQVLRHEDVFPSIVNAA